MPRRESSFFPTSGIPATFVQSPLIPSDPAGGTAASLSLSLSFSLFLLPPSVNFEAARPAGRRREPRKSVPSHLSPVSAVSCPGPYVTRSVAKLLIISIYIGSA